MQERTTRFVVANQLGCHIFYDFPTGIPNTSLLPFFTRASETKDAGKPKAKATFLKIGSAKQAWVNKREHKENRSVTWILCSPCCIKNISKQPRRGNARAHINNAAHQPIIDNWLIAKPLVLRLWANAPLNLQKSKSWKTLNKKKRDKLCTVLTRLFW